MAQVPHLVRQVDHDGERETGQQMREQLPDQQADGSDDRELDEFLTPGQ